MINEENNFHEFSNPGLKRFKIFLNPKTVVWVNEKQIIKESWIKHFGSLEAVQNFINNYNG